MSRELSAKQRRRIASEGERAFQAGLPATANPYPHDSDQYLVWNCAWSSAEPAQTEG